MDKILGIIFLIATVLVGFISGGKIELNKTWTIVIFVVQIASWVGYINLLDIKKRYKIWLSVLSTVAACIIGFFYMMK
ncbi:hypothetical protein [Streptococcus equi]|uniref:Uncharacterized protein n=1 Tax=Streptococcus equi subsp. zooepidemicus Sz4is TaxID=1381082 RepID=A0AAW3GJ00_STRSZ|nr:hypothetical protein AT55_01806 [Streptococcus equi subsp. zooepidemicus Sz4is]